jgi:hypothetical protein
MQKNAQVRGESAEMREAMSHGNGRIAAIGQKDPLSAVLCVPAYRTGTLDGKSSILVQSLAYIIYIQYIHGTAVTALD